MTAPAQWGRAAPRALLSLTAVALLVAAGGLVLAGWESSVVGSGSMSPAVERGDVIVTSPPDHEKPIAAGSVIRFDHPSRPGRSMLHRIAGMTANGLLVTKGDANPAADTTPVPASAVTGLGRLRVPLVGLPVLWWLEHDYPPLLATAAMLLSLALLVPRKKARRPEAGRRA